MNRIGLLFGSFNPIHNGHIQTAKKAIEEDIVDQVCFVISKQNPFKPPYEVLDVDRVNMLMCLYDIPNCYFDIVELTRELQDTRTYNVLQYFKEAFFGAQFVIICGQDVYEEMPKWYKGEELLKEKIYVVPRNSTDISSSNIRYRIKHELDFEDLVPRKVYDYIKTHNLYVDNTEIERTKAKQ